MDAIQNYEDGSYVDDLMKLLAQLGEMRSELVRVEHDFEAKTRQIHESHKQSARNFLHYLALRQRDIRPLQETLARLGLSSLGRSESHVLANLDAVLEVLRRLARCESVMPVEKAIDFKAGRCALERNTTTLLGPKPAGREVRIMVTMPSEAADDYHLVRDLVDAGMDCMRVNCAHDNEDAWLGMVENLERAKAELNRECRILMDLPGPKLRTGFIEPLPGIIKWRPHRDRYGRVIEPARIWIACNENSCNRLPAADACLAVPREWLAKLQRGDTIKFFDARGRSRSMAVKEISENGCWAESAKTAYIAGGTLLRVSRANDGGTTAVDLARIDDLPPEPQPIRLKNGDVLMLTSNATPGRPAIYDVNGKCLQAPTVGVSLPEIFSDVHPDESIWFDDGKIGGMVRSVQLDEIAVEITKAGTKGEKLWSDKGINLPDTKLRLPALTDDDLSYLPFIVRHADLIGYSFVRSESDIAALQSHLNRLGGERLGIVLKIETRQAFEALPHLLFAAMRGAATGVMIARGDLAVECGFERTGEIQEEIMWLAEAAHLPVIWATQVLETLAKKGHPSRAEITDAAMAERAECVMLNKGPYVVEAVQMLDDVLRRMQSHQAKKISLLRQLKLAHRFCCGEGA
jgi:pyruvate kinase